MRYVFACVFFLSLALPAAAFQNAAAARREPRILIGGDYFPAVHNALSRARRSIDIVMYFMIMDREASAHPVNVLVDDLVAAAKRNVKVRVILENEKFEESRLAFETLRGSGVAVYYDTPKTYLHSKAVVIDSRTCIFGSTNWSKTAFYGNHEISILIDSNELARKIGASLSGILLQRTPPVPVEEQGLLIPEQFLLSPRQGGRLVKDRADKAFALYLLLLKESRAARSPIVKLDYEKYARRVGYEAPPGAGAGKYYYEKLRRPLKRLEKRYKLIQYDHRRKTIVLLAPSSPKRFALPPAYWEYGLNERLSLRAKYAYLIALLEARKSVKNPYWFRSQEDLAGIYGPSDYTISLGLLELERENIIEIIRGERTEDGFGRRKANIYQVNRLISPAEFRRSIDSLEASYGSAITAQARSLSGRLDEPKDLTKIEIYIHLIKEYGFAAVEKANEKVSRYKKGSALRRIATTIKLLKR